jgi:hypothetical protein
VDVTWGHRLSAFWEKNQTVLVTAMLGVLGTVALAIWRRAWVWNKLRAWRALL